MNSFKRCHILLLGFILTLVACGSPHDPSGQGELDSRLSSIFGMLGEGQSMGIPMEPPPDKNHTQLIPSLPVVTNVEVGDQELKLYWNPRAGADHYKIYWRLAGFEDEFGPIEIPLSFNNWPITGLENGTAYDVCVRAENADDQGLLCTDGNGVNTGWIGPHVPQSDSPPSVPTLLPIESNGLQIIVKWLRVEQALGYNIRFESPLNQIVHESHVSQPAPGSLVQYANFFGSVGVTYWIRVNSENENGSSDFSQAVPFTIGAPTISLNSHQFTFTCSAGGQAPSQQLEINSGNGQLLSWEAYISDPNLLTMEDPDGPSDLSGVAPPLNRRVLSVNCDQPPSLYNLTIILWATNFPGVTTTVQVTLSVQATQPGTVFSRLDGHVYRPQLSPWYWNQTCHELRVGQGAGTAYQTLIEFDLRYVNIGQMSSAFLLLNRLGLASQPVELHRLVGTPIQTDPNHIPSFLSDFAWEYVTTLDMSPSYYEIDVSSYLEQDIIVFKIVNPAWNSYTRFASSRHEWITGPRMHLQY